MELAENKQLLKHLTDSQVKRGSTPNPTSKNREMPGDTQKDAAAWHESG
jgi:hypothetical protein